MIVSVLILLAACREAKVIEMEGEFDAVFEAYIQHFGKNYTAPAERAWRKRVLYERVKGYSVPDVPLREQVPFHSVLPNQDVAMPYFVFPNSCGDHAIISDHSDLSDEERIKKFALQMDVTKKDIEESKKSLKEMYPQFSHVINKIGVGKNSIYLPTSKREFLRIKVKKSKNKNVRKISKSDMELFFDTILPKNKPIPGQTPPLLKSCNQTPTASKLESRLLAQEQSRKYISQDLAILGGYAFRKHITYKFNMPAIRDQMGCGACYAFAVVELLGLMYNIGYNTDLVFSVRDIIACGTQRGYRCSGCLSGDMMGAVDYINAHGIAYEDDYPFYGREGICKKHMRRRRLRINPLPFEPRIHNILTALEKAPLILPLYITYAFTHHLDGKSIVHHHDCRPRSSRDSNGNRKKRDTHAMMILGHHLNTKDVKTPYGVSYLIARNTWAETWGEEGYIRLAFDDTDVEDFFPCVMKHRNVIQFAVTDR